MAKSPRIWIVDGHNLIFHIPHLEELQSSGRRREARQRLEDALSRFSARAGERMVVVYDGNRMERNPDTISEEHFRTVYAQPPEEADDRVVFLSRRYLKEGYRVRVVTSDLRMMEGELPEGISHVTAQEFRRRHLAASNRAPGKEIRGDFSDVEAELLRRAEEHPPPVERPSRPRSRPPAPLPPPPSPSPAQASPEEKPSMTMPPMSLEAQEALLLKRAKGRRRQERRHGRKKKRS